MEQDGGYCGESCKEIDIRGKDIMFTSFVINVKQIRIAAYLFCFIKIENMILL